MPQFEYDAIKSDANLEKHGIDFIEAQELWHDLLMLNYELPHPFEERFAIIALFKSKIWTAIYTIRGEKLRIISVRRSRKDEKEAYERGRI